MNQQQPSKNRRRTEKPSVAIVCPGDLNARQHTTPEASRFNDLFQAFRDIGANAELAIYHDDFRDDVYHQCLKCDAVLVWVNPIQEGHDRSILDAMLREIADNGIFVSTHPDVILKLGTKSVLYDTRTIGWGTDTRQYHSLEELAEQLPIRLTSGETRVLKQHRSSSGDGVWKVHRADSNKEPQSPEDINLVVRHAIRGSQEEHTTLNEFLKQCEAYFTAGGVMVDQPYQQRLPEGMTRCYLVHDTVVGFGHQAINALFPTPVDAKEAPQPGPRLYHPPDKPEFQLLKQQLEQDWLPQATELLALQHEQLPIIWDCDFLLGPKTLSGEDTWVLCEINTSSVAPYPPTAVEPIVRATIARIR